MGTLNRQFGYNHSLFTIMLGSSCLKATPKQTAFLHIRMYPTALAGVAQWVEHWPGNQRVWGWIPSQGSCLGFRAGPQ